MQKLVLLSAITCVLCACSEQACDLTGERYAKMMKEGTVFNEKDQACVQASIIQGAEATRPKTMPRLITGGNKS